MTESLDWIGNQRALQGYGEEGDRATSNEEGEASATEEEAAATKKHKDSDADQSEQCH